MQRAVEWRIYYADGTTFDSQQGRPQDAPWYGVVVILMYDEDFNGRGVLSDDPLSCRENDYYWWHVEDAMWYGGKDTDALILFAMFPDRVHSLKHGQTLKNTLYRSIVERAKADPDFLPAAMG